MTVELQNISEDVAVQLPVVVNLRRTIRSQRQARNQYPIPASREEITEIPNEFRFLENGEEVSLVMLTGYWFVDGTFKVCPTVQLYKVHAQNNGSILPYIFGLLPNKFQATYNEAIPLVMALMKFDLI